jgi:putative endonuclease
MNESYVYILASKRNGTLYIGATTNLIKRIWQHKNKVVPGFTAKYSVDKLVYYETHGDISTAYEREKQMKHWARNTKVKVIESFNPTWRDLYDEIAYS